MTETELWQVVCAPLPQRNYKSARRRAFAGRVFVVLCGAAVIFGGLAAFNN